MDRVIEMQVAGYQIRRGGEALGAMGTGNAVLLRFHFDSAWDGLGKCAKFTDARGEGGITTVVELLSRNADGSYTVPVPREAMAYEGVAELSLVGELTENGCVTKRLTTKPLPLRIYASGADRTAQNTEPITATDKQQILAKLNAAEAYARGTADGIVVPERAEDNAKYYKEQAENAAGLAHSSASQASSDAKAAAEAKSDIDKLAQRAQAAAGDAGSYRDEASISRELAQSAQGAAEAAKTDAETAATAVSSAAQLIAELEAHRYDAFPCEDHMGAVIHTSVGADDIPAKMFDVSLQDVGDKADGLRVTVKRCGKNMFEREKITFLRNTRIGDNGSLGTSGTDTGYASSNVFIPVRPNSEYVFSGVIDREAVSAGVYCYVATYTSPNMDTFISRTRCDADGNVRFTTGTNERFILLIVPESRMLSTNIMMYYEKANIRPQLECGSTATAYEAFNGTSYTVTASKEGQYSLEPVPRTMLGQNTFFIVPENEDNPKIIARLRLDPTLAYENLKSAIVAAGTN